MTAASISVEPLGADRPLLLLPVRIETRFMRDRRELWIRIYPDEIAANSHEAPLTAGERDAGFAYWQAGWDPAGEAQAWRALLAVTTAPRAAWIVRATTPVNLATRPQGTPQFPTVVLRDGAWTRAVTADVLPARWQIRLYRDGALVRTVDSGPVSQPLVLSLGPDSDPASAITLPDEGTGLVVDPRLAWTVDFTRALAVGMAVVVAELTDSDLAVGFDRVLVAGIASSESPTATGERVAALLDAHHYTRGLAFVRAGTPTNNAPDFPSGFPPADPNGAASFAVERGAPLATPGSDGDRFARALGLGADVVAHVAGAGASAFGVAGAMSTALYPATLGYFLAQMMDPVFAADAIASARDLFIGGVRGRGALPAFRVGAVPYGVLPVGALGAFRDATPAGTPARGWMDLLVALRDYWRGQTGAVPRLGRTGDPDRDLVETLSMDGASAEVWARRAMGPDLRRTLIAFLGSDWQGWFVGHEQLAAQLGALLGHPEWRPRLYGVTLGEQASQYAAPLVADLPSETDRLDFDYVGWIGGASIDDLRAERLPAGVAPPTALLYQLLRNAALATYADAAFQLHLRAGTVTAADRREVELRGISDRSAGMAPVWARFSAVLPAITGTATVGEYVTAGGPDPALVDVAAFRSALAVLGTLPTAELERLTAETLDVCSHRLDAWICALYARRLDELRATTAGGLHLGAFGWVEGLRPAPPATDGGGQSDGFIHAPSMAHAATAAVLRNAYLGRDTADRTRYAIDLSSARVRDATWLLDCVREGQPLGAVLGYRFERGLHEGHPGLALDKYIDPFRRLYPLVANKIETSNLPADAIAARNVVDGLALDAAARAGTIPFGQSGLPAGGDDRAAIEAELAALDDLVDAVADLMTAESVYQLVRGNAEGSGAALDAVGRATRPPEPGVAAQPRGGTALTHRFAVLLGGDPVGAAGWAAIPASPRATIEPYLDGWAGTLLGDPADVHARLRYQTAAAPGTWIDGSIRLADLPLRPLDVLALAGAPPPPGGRSALDLLILDAVETQVGASLAAIDIAYTETPAPNLRSFAALLELARAIGDLVGAARPLAPADLVAPERASSVPLSSALPGEAGARADAAAQLLADVRKALRDATDALAATDPNSSPDLSDARAALRSAFQLGVADSLPGARFGSSPAARADVLARATRVLAELDRRVAAAASGAPPDRAQAVFGRNFTFLPRLLPSDPAGLGAALAAAGSLGADTATLARWAQQVAAVRAPVAAWRRMTVLARASADARCPLEVAQLPPPANHRWVGLPFASEADRPAGGALSLAWHRAARPAADAPWVGLLLDEWNEVIPSRSEQTAVTFHYDDPGAEAPQAVLLAVAPPAAKAWSADLIFETLADTLELAKLRGVLAQDLGILGQLLPAIYLPSNTRGETVATELGALAGAATIARAGT